MTISEFYDEYPKGVEENLEWRIRCRGRALEDVRFRHALYDACILRSPKVGRKSNRTPRPRRVPSRWLCASGK